MGPCPAPAPSPRYLVEFGQHWPCLLLLLVLLHLGLQPPVVLQGLLPPLHRHVEAREDTAKPAGHSGSETGLFLELQAGSSSLIQKYVSSAYQAPDSVLGLGDLAVNEIDGALALVGHRLRMSPWGKARARKTG